MKKIACALDLTSAADADVAILLSKIGSTNLLKRKRKKNLKTIFFFVD